MFTHVTVLLDNELPDSETQCDLVPNEVNFHKSLGAATDCAKRTYENYEGHVSHRLAMVFAYDPCKVFVIPILYIGIVPMDGLGTVNVNSLSLARLSMKLSEYVRAANASARDEKGVANVNA